MIDCVICHDRPPVGHSMIDGGCYARLRGDLATVEWAYGLLGEQLLALPAAWKPGSIGAAGGSRPPLSLAVVDARANIEGVLGSWARMVAEEHQPALHGPADGSVPAVGAWLDARMPWISDQPWVDEFARELGELRRAAHALAPWGRARRDLPLPCPETACGLLTLSWYADTDSVICRNRLCGLSMTIGQYRDEVSAWMRTASERREVMAA